MFNAYGVDVRGDRTQGTRLRREPWAGEYNAYGVGVDCIDFKEVHALAK